MTSPLGDPYDGRGPVPLDPWSPAPVRSAPQLPELRRSAPPARSLLVALAAAVIGVNAGLLSAAVLTLSLKATAISPSGATTVLSIVVGVASVFALIGYPVIGRLSDRTTSRWGRRRPYLVLGAVLIVVGAVLTLQAATTAVLTVAYVIMMVGSVSALVAAAAVVPDQVDPAHRGGASTVIGLGTPIGAVVGLFLAQLVAPHLAAMILLPSGIAALSALVLAMVLKDRRLSPAERPAFGARDLLSTFWVSPTASPAFAWAWLSRLMLFLGVAAVNAYQAFYLIMVLHVAAAEVAGQIFIATLVLTAMSMIFAPLAGRASDRMQRRKPFVILSALVFGIGLALVAHATSFVGFLVAVAVMGLGQGVYFAVDFALVTQVLPDPTNPGKDLGLMNLASNLPASIVPAVAPALLAVGASATTPQNFTVLFTAGAICALIGALAILPIRGVS